MECDNLLCLNVGGTKVDYSFIEKKHFLSLKTFEDCVNLSKKIKVNSFLRKNNEDKIINLLNETKYSSIAIASPIMSQKIIYDSKFGEKLIKCLNSLVKKKKTIIENDSSCSGLSYLFQKQDIVFVTLGTGIGTGIIINNKLMKGNFGFFGEIGTIPFKKNTLEKETVSKKIELFRRKEDVSVNDFKSYLEDFENMGKINPKIKGYLNDFENNMSFVFDLICFCYDPKKIIIGGSVSRLIPNLKEKILKKCTFPYIKKTQIELSKIRYSELIGAFLNFNINFK